MPNARFIPAADWTAAPEVDVVDGENLFPQVPAGTYYPILSSTTSIVVPQLTAGTIDNVSPTEGDTLTVTPGNETGTATYQWQKDGVDITGATSASFDTTGEGTGDYRRGVSDGVQGPVYTDAVTVGAVATAPAQMAAPSLAVDSQTQITATLAADPADGGSPITSYDLRYSTDDATWTDVIGVTSPEAITGLTAGTLYYVQARAVNVVDNGPWSTSATATTSAATAPAAFTSGQWTATTGSGASEIDINITALPSDGGSAITALQYSTDAGATWAALSGTGTGSRTVDQHSDGTTGTLTPSTSYDVMARAVNALGSGPDSDTKTVLAGAAASGFTENAVVVNLGASIVADQGIDNMPGFLLFSSFTPILTSRQAIFNVARRAATQVYINSGNWEVLTNGPSFLTGQVKSFQTGVRHHVLMAASCDGTEATVRTAIWDAQSGVWTTTEDVLPYTNANLNLQEDVIRLFARTTAGDAEFFSGTTFRQAYWDFDTESDVPDVTTPAVQDLFASGASLVDPVTTQDEYASANIAGLSRLFFDIYGTAADLNSATIPQPGIATMSKFGSEVFS
jgi:hypothetical protein